MQPFLNCSSVVEYSFLISCSQSWWHLGPSCFVCLLHTCCSHDCSMKRSYSFFCSWKLRLLAFNPSSQGLRQVFVEQRQSCVWKVDFELPRSLFHSSAYFDGQLVQKAVECFGFSQDHDLINPSAHRKVQTSHCCHILHLLVPFLALASSEHSSRSQVECSCHGSQRLLAFDSSHFCHFFPLLLL